MSLRFASAAAAAQVLGPKVASQVTRPEYQPVRQRRRGMNRTEREYAQQLEARRRAGEVLWFEFEGMRLRLADDTFFRPDFPVLTPAGLEFHEVKGHMREAARVRLNVAAAKFPFAFYLVRKDRTGFTVNRVGAVPRGTNGD